MHQVALTSDCVFNYHCMKTIPFKKNKKRGHGAKLQNQNPSLHISVHTYPSRRNSDISGVCNEHFLWQPAHLIHLTLKKTEHLWQTVQRKIELWILIVEVNEQIGLEVCHLSASRDALVWIHPSTFVSSVTSRRKQQQSMCVSIEFSSRRFIIMCLDFGVKIVTSCPKTIIQIWLEAMLDTMRAAWYACTYTRLNIHDKRAKVVCVCVCGWIVIYSRNTFVSAQRSTIPTSKPAQPQTADSSLPPAMTS